MKRLNDQTILQLYEEFSTPAHVRGHCRGVTECALKLADALMEADPQLYHLDKALLYGAGMVHDMARTQEHHEIVAADKLEAMGFHEEAEIVRYHMKTMTYHEIEQVTEADLLYISDRMVLEDTFVGLEKRMEYLREKMIRNGRDPESEHARRNRRCSREFVEAIERKTGRSVMEICRE